MKGIRLGLTGTIGSGKSTVLSLLARQGWRVVRTDDLARKELDKPQQKQRLRERWGTRILSENGEIDRRKVAGIVFSDPDELAWLEEFLHPLVRERWLAVLRDDPHNDLVVEIPLLFEKKLASHFDFVVSVDCPEPQQLSRLRAKGFSDEDIEARKRRQFSAGVKNSLADFVLTNNGTVPFLEQQIFRLSQRLRASH